MRILFIGDIIGRPGRRSVARWLPEVQAAEELDFVVANAENAAGGLGVTQEVLRELQQSGIHAFTLGNHTWRKKAIIPALEALPHVVRPANYPKGVPGRGSSVITLADGRTVGLVNLLGRVYMEPMECPFACADAEIAALRERTPLVVVDIHAEATSEKVALGWHLDGRATAVVGTHTHVQTADEWVLPNGTAYITDVGMCGPRHSVIGVVRERVIEKFMTGMPRKFDVAKGPLQFSAVLIEADEETGRALRIERILLREEDEHGTSG